MGGKINGNLTESGGLIAIFSSKLVLAFHDETLAFSAGLSRMKPLRGRHKRTWSDGSPAGERHDRGLKIPVLDKPAENAKTLTMESKTGLELSCVP